MTRASIIALSLSLLFVGGRQADAQFANVGSIAFPTSGSGEAHQHFLRGVAILHSFGFKQAREEFQAAQQLDPGFAMAYWGEALAYNHPLFSQQDVDSAQAGAGPPSRDAIRAAGQGADRPRKRIPDGGRDLVR